MITIFTLTYNEEILIEFMIKHYRERFPNCRIVIYDNMSKDNTVKIAKNINCEVMTFDTKNEYSEQRLIDIRNTCWKDAQTNWVLVCDLDELLDINEHELMAESKLGTTIIRTETFDMINLKDNLDIADIKYGVPSPLSGKSCLFNKKYITEMNYGPGSHSCDPIGKVVYSKKTYKLYHYNSLGENFTIQKFKDRGSRMSRENLEKGWGIHYLMTPKEIRDEYRLERKKAIRVR